MPPLRPTDPVPSAAVPGSVAGCGNKKTDITCRPEVAQLGGPDGARGSKEFVEVRVRVEIQPRARAGRGVSGALPPGRAATAARLPRTISGVGGADQRSLSGDGDDGEDRARRL